MQNKLKKTLFINNNNWYLYVIPASSTVEDLSLTWNAGFMKLKQDQKKISSCYNKMLSAHSVIFCPNVGWYLQKKKTKKLQQAQSINC